MAFTENEKTLAIGEISILQGGLVKAGLLLSGDSSPSLILAALVGVREGTKDLIKSLSKDYND